MKVPVAMNGNLPSEMNAMAIGRMMPRGIAESLKPRMFIGSCFLLMPSLSVCHILYSVAQSYFLAASFLTTSFMTIENKTISRTLKKFLSQKPSENAAEPSSNARANATAIIDAVRCYTSVLVKLIWILHRPFLALLG